MDLILSAVFGLQANSQDNPDDPFIKAARQALKQSFSKKILLGSPVPEGGSDLKLALISQSINHV